MPHIHHSCLGKQVHVGKFGTNSTFEKHLVIWTRRDNSTALQRRVYGWALRVMEEVSQRPVWFWPSLSLKSEQGAFCYICNSMHVLFFWQIIWRWNNVWEKEIFTWFGLASLGPNGWHFHNKIVVVSCFISGGTECNISEGMTKVCSVCSPQLQNRLHLQ